jgi:hypothetical protein
MFSKTIGFLSRPWMNHRTRMAARGSLKTQMPQMCTDQIPTMKAVVKMFVLDGAPNPSKKNSAFAPPVRLKVGPYLSVSLYFLLRGLIYSTH